MPIIPLDVSAIYSAVQNQNTRSTDETTARENQRPEDPPAREANSESGPAVTTTLSQAGLESSRAVEPAERSLEQSSLGQEIAEEKAIESQLAQARLAEDRQEQNQPPPDPIDLVV